MIIQLLNKLAGDISAKTVKRLNPLIGKINDIEADYQKTLLQDSDFSQKTQEFKDRLKNGATLEDLLPEAFALVKYACRRNVGRKWLVRNQEITWDMVPFDVQLLGGMVLHQGNIAEMKTGEGKTLVCTLPAYLNALTEKGVFVVTVNEYLADRDAEWMGGLYKYLGLTVGVIKHGQSHQAKKEAYACDIVYGTNNEYGFDYLRDNMATHLGSCVQRNLNYAIVDEVDSILIDEARTPLIISAAAEESTAKYSKYARLLKQLIENEDYNIDEKLKTATLTEAGIAKMEKWLEVDNIYSESGFEEVHHIEQGLKAQAVYRLDVDYVIKEGEIIIVDEFTGRLMPGRRYSDGLHQAIEAKENVEIKRESRTLATITFQNYFRLFNKLAGMTGTALTEAEEFYKIYGLEVICIPTNQKMIRQDLNDLIYKTEKGKFLAVIAKAKELHAKGQPILIGTISIEKSEVLSKLLKLEGIAHTVLNAKKHESEAEIVAKAGQKNAVTIATNMAGRGTDIKLGSGVVELGGLFIAGTERHESRRIDNQLRGRSGRQGDPGASQFYVSMEDELMRLFGGDKVKNMMEFLKVPDDMPIENKIISGAIESAQKKVEGHNFDIRKHLLEYDDVMNKHRDIIYSRRRKILESTNLKNDILLLVEKQAEEIVLKHTEGQEPAHWNYQEIFATVTALHKDPAKPIKLDDLEILNNQEELISSLKKYLMSEYEIRESHIPDPNILRQIERNIYLRVLDTLWMEHIDNMTSLREAVSLRGYGQRDPLIEYKEQAFLLFEKLITDIEANTVNTLFKMDIVKTPTPAAYEETEPDLEQLLTNVDDIKETSPSTRGFVSDDQGVTRLTVGEKKHVQTVNNQPKIGRNDPCPCGATKPDGRPKKYKHCCGR